MFSTEKMLSLIKNAIFDHKKAPAASRQPREIVFFLEKRYYAPTKGACGKPPAEENCVFPKETQFLTKKKAPAAIGQSEGKMLVEKWSQFLLLFSSLKNCILGKKQLSSCWPVAAGVFFG